MAVLFSLPAIIAVTWYEWEFRPLHRYELASVRLRFLGHSQGLASPSDSQRHWKADRSCIPGQLDSRNRLFQLAPKLLPTWANWTRRVNRKVEANHILN